MMPCADHALARALVALLTAYGPVQPIGHDMADWASATFSGESHLVRLKMPCPSPPDMIALATTLAEAEIELGNRLLADLALAGHARDGEDMILEIEALTLVPS